MKPTRRQMAVNVAVMIGSLVVFFGAFEIIVRLVGPDLSLPQAEQQFQFTQTNEFELPHHARDPKLGWRLAPGTYGPMRINASGFRGRDASQAAPDDVRIAHLGDSCTMGFTVASDRDVYSTRLEVLLRKQGIPAQTFNFGVDGYSSHQGLLLLPEVLETVHPQFVTLYFGYNDHHWSNASDRDMAWTRSGWRSVLEHSHAYRFLRRHVLRLARREARLVEPKRRVSLPEFEENLRDMVALAREHGSRVVLLTTPLRPRVPLTENEVLVSIDGEPRWVTQTWWVENAMRQRGLDVHQGGTPQHQAVLRDIIQQHPEWPWPHFLLARELRDAGDEQGMRRELLRSRQLDNERAVMQTYNDTVRRVAQDLDVPLVDLAHAFPERQLVFNDVVHPNAEGHARIAALLAERIQELETP
jgi:lysophospholipase L1-like esterase